MRIKGIHGTFVPAGSQFLCVSHLWVFVDFRKRLHCFTNTIDHSHILSLHIYIYLCVCAAWIVSGFVSSFSSCMSDFRFPKIPRILYISFTNFVLWFRKIPVQHCFFRLESRVYIQSVVVVLRAAMSDFPAAFPRVSPTTSCLADALVDNQRTWLPTLIFAKSTPTPVHNRSFGLAPAGRSQQVSDRYGIPLISGASAYFGMFSMFSFYLQYPPVISSPWQIGAWYPWLRLLLQKPRKRYGPPIATCKRFCRELISLLYPGFCLHICVLSCVCHMHAGPYRGFNAVMSLKYICFLRLYLLPHIWTAQDIYYAQSRYSLVWNLL